MPSKTDMSKVLAFVAASVLGTATVGAVTAQDSPLSPTTPTETPAEMSPGPSEEYSKLDTDRDGKISRQEARRNKDLMKKWTSLDANKDGKLDEGEFAQFEVQPPSSPAEPPKEAPKTAPPVM